MMTFIKSGGLWCVFGVLTITKTYHRIILFIVNPVLTTLLGAQDDNQPTTTHHTIFDAQGGELL